MSSNRPPIVSLLCLARDAASRLPDGLGTRADILELIKHSQWIKLEACNLEQQNNIVSGALDRLHQQDQCVRYDQERKIWIYNHRNCKIDNVKWQPIELGRRRNDFKTNSIVGELELEHGIEKNEGEEKDSSLWWSNLLPLWHQSTHKETNDVQAAGLMVNQKEK